MENSELITLLSGFLGMMGTIAALARKFYKQASSFIEEQKDFQEAIKVIQKEVTPNGGSSLKDVVNKLKITCDRMEVRQRVIDQRSKASLHYQTEALFEIDRSGNMTWCNDAFRTLMVEEGGVISTGKDWIAVIDEDHRECFVAEIESCLKMCRKIDIETKDTQGCVVSFTGYPYKIGRNNHEGFLIYLKIEREN